jgi:protocatechuate 3,4-dioxygenase beta subunit
VFLTNATGVVTNSINVTSYGNDTNTTNETNITVNGSANITAIKTANVSSAVVGDVVSYEINVTNNANVSGDFNVTDYFHNNDLVFVMGNASVGVFGNATVVFDPSTLTWSVSNLDAGQTVSLYINFTVNATGIVGNSINVTSVGNDTNTTNETNITVNRFVNISVVKTANVSSAVLGDHVVYTITVTNNGNHSEDFTVVDYYNGYDLVYINGSFVISADDASKVNYLGDLVWNVIDLGPGESVSWNVTFIVNATGIITNHVKITNENGTVNDTNNSIIVNGSENITAIKTANVSNANLGDVVSYNIMITNNGNHSGDYNVTDYFNDWDLVYNGYSVIYSGNASDVDFNGVDTWTIWDLKANSTIIIVVNFTTNATGIITNHINVSSYGNDTNTTNETNITVNGSENITAIKTANVTSVVLGGSVSYNITIVNNGNHSGDYNVTDYFNGRDLVYNGYSVIYSGNASGVDFNGVDTWTIWDLKANSSIVIVVNFTTNASGIITNRINVTSYGNDTNTTNETNITVTTNKKVNITVDVPENTTVGDNITVNITVTDEDGNPIANVTVEVVVDGKVVGNFTTDEDGKVYVNVTVTDPSEDVNVTFGGNNEYTPGNGSGVINSSLAKVNITVDVPKDTTIGDNVTVNITVADKDGNPIANVTVEVVVDGKVIGNFTTDEDGKIHVNVTVTDPVEDVNVTFGGNEHYAPGNGSGVIVSDLVDSKLVIDVPANSYVGDDVVVNVTLVDEFGNPIVGESVEIMIDGVSIGNFTTDAKGMIHIPVHIVDTETVINAIFDGSERYYPTVSYKIIESNIHYNRTIRNASHIIVDDVSSDIGKEVELTAKVTDDNGNPISGVRVKFYVNGKYVGSALTDIDGIATLPYTSKYAGVFYVLGVFEGNSQYNASEDIGILNVADNGSDNGGNNTNGGNGSDVDTGGAGMKSTGVPLIAILVLLLFLIAIIARRKKKNTE